MQLKQRFYLPGEEWFYCKIYCSIRTGEVILKGIIYPMANKFFEQNMADKWFFVRYHDPEFHLRIRIHLTDLGHYARIVQEFGKNLKVLLDEDLIHNVQMEIYERELERYGERTIEKFESVFFLDSVYVMKFILSEKVHINNRWLFGAMKIDRILEMYGLDLKTKRRLMSELRNAFAAEFGMDRKLKKQIEEKYNSNKEILRKYLATGTDFDLSNPIQESISDSFSRDYSNDYNDLILALHDAIPEIELQDKIKSHLHMFLNRLFCSKQRLQEFILYYFLFKEYDFYLGRERCGYLNL